MDSGRESASSMKYHLDRHERHARQITGRDFHVRCVYSWPGRTNANRARARDRSTVTGAHAAHEKTLKRPQHEHALEDAGCLRPGAALRTPGAAYPLGAPAFCGTRVSLAPSPTSPLPLPTSTAPPTHTPQKESGRPMTVRLPAARRRPMPPARWSPLSKSACPTRFTPARTHDTNRRLRKARSMGDESRARP